MSRLPIAGLILLGLTGWSFAQESEPVEELQQKLEAQFDELDQDKDGSLDEMELDDFSQRRLQKLQEHGLRKEYPLPRDEFIAAGIAEMTSKDEKNPGKDEEGQPRKELKIDGSSSESPAEPQKGAVVTSRRNSSKKNRFVPELPADYQARDKNGDGQIGLYEWDRAKYAEFAKLDKNGDGFLTPAELAPKGSFKTGGSNAGAGGSRSTNPGGIDEEVRGAFGNLDRGRDGAIDEEEWARSRRTREMFEQAGINVSLPMDVNAFAALYRRAKEASGNNNERR